MQPCFGKAKKPTPTKETKPSPNGKMSSLTPQVAHNQELAFMSGVSGRLSQLTEIKLPEKEVIIHRQKIVYEEIKPNTSDRRELKQLLRTKLDPKEVYNYIDDYPQNPMKFWKVERAVRLIGLPLNIWIGAFCWSPLKMLVDTPGDAEIQPAGFHIIYNRLENLIIEDLKIAEHIKEKGINIVLYAGSTSGWTGELISNINDNIYCLYLKPSQYGGWAPALPIKQIENGELEWFYKNMYPEDDDAIHQRIDEWFKKEGCHERRWFIEDAAQNADVTSLHIMKYIDELVKQKPEIMEL